MAATRRSTSARMRRRGALCGEDKLGAIGCGAAGVAGTPARRGALDQSQQGGVVDAAARGPATSRVPVRRARRREAGGWPGS
jgi:hypothetical protein